MTKQGFKTLLRSKETERSYTIDREFLLQTDTFYC